MKIQELFKLPLYWEMANAEKVALFTLLNEIKPSIAIEIGTKEGGSLQLISALSNEVYTLDIDPGVRQLSNKFSNVNFVIGNSRETLPQLLNELASKNQQPDLILVDGDHSSDGVEKDLQNILEMKITRPLFILMHDSFNPDCRQGMLAVNYEDNPYVEFVDIDFIQGIYSPGEKTKGQMWGGFGIIYMKPNPLKQIPLVKQTSEYSYNRLYHLSRHFFFLPGSLKSRIRSYIFRRMFP